MRACRGRDAEVLSGAQKKTAGLERKPAVQATLRIRSQGDRDFLISKQCHPLRDQLWRKAVSGEFRSSVKLCHFVTPDRLEFHANIGATVRTVLNGHPPSLCLAQLAHDGQAQPAPAGDSAA